MDKGRIDKPKNFDSLWREAKNEIFRLELLNVYKVASETEAFRRYMEGKPLNSLEAPGFKDWLSKIEDKTKNGVTIVDVQVLDLPMSDYLKFGITCASFLAEEKGEKFLFIERKNVSKLIRGFQDYWMFDSKTVIPMNYDEEGSFISKGKPISDQNEISDYLKLKDKLLKIGMPMREFLRVNDIILI
jgi:hypothetical protein